MATEEEKKKTMAKLHAMEREIKPPVLKIINEWIGTPGPAKTPEDGAQMFEKYMAILSLGIHLKEFATEAVLAKITDPVARKHIEDIAAHLEQQAKEFLHTEVAAQAARFREETSPGLGG